MKKTLKRTLILAVMVMCVFAIFTVATSAATYADDNAAIAGGAVARVGEAGTGTYYDNIDDALDFVRTNEGYDTVILLQDCAASASIDRTNASYIAKAITIKSNVTDKANAPALTISHRWNVGRASSNGQLTFENLKLNLNASSYTLVCDNESGVTFNNVIINTAALTPVLSNAPSTATYTFNGCEIVGGTGTEAIAMGWDGTTSTVVISNSTTNVPFFKARAANTNITMKIESQYTYTGSGDIVVDNGCVVKYDDASAKILGYNYRVGDTALGAIGKVYFATKDDALAAAPAGVKVYDISGDTPAEVAKPCEHEFGEATCTKKATCTKCGAETGELAAHNYGEATCSKKATCTACGAETGELARHTYSKATCTEKAKCTVCGAERGELAKHVDADNNGKCDKCDAAITVATTGAETTGAAEEEKKGCGGTVTVAGIALVAALGTCAVFVEKKRR